MDPTSEPLTPGESQVATSHCDVCSVTRVPAGLAIHFGQLAPSAADARATGVSMRHRVVLSEGIAAKLQDVLTALLDEAADRKADVK